tara:strand:+ start:1854 stop:2105 length:252 start_codon:yes stop_codon:yes gene_type:complete
MIETIQDNAEKMIHNELILLLKESKDGETLDVICGALEAVFKFAYTTAPKDILAVNVILGSLYLVTNEQIDVGSIAGELSNEG